MSLDGIGERTGSGSLSSTLLDRGHVLPEEGLWCGSGKVSAVGGMREGGTDVVDVTSSVELDRGLEGDLLLGVVGGDGGVVVAFKLVEVVDVAVSPRK